jgi:hypothetical protein
MLKRKGKYVQNEVPGFASRLTDGEFASYNAAFDTIERDFRQIESVREHLDKLAKIRWEQPAPKNFASITTSDGTRWDAFGLLLTLPKTEILLCRKADGDELAIVQKLTGSGSYARQHVSSSILLTGNRSERDLVANYIAEAEHTLRFMARNLVAKAQKVVWEQYPDHNPSQVMRAISQRCALATENAEAIKQTQAQKKPAVQQSRGIGI